MKLTNRQIRRLLPIAAAALLFLCAWLIPMHRVVELVLCILSFLLSGLDMVAPVLGEVKTRRYTGRPLLLLAAGLVSLCVGAHLSSAAMLLLYRIGAILLEMRRSRTEEVLKTRLSLHPLAGELSGNAVQPVIHGKVPRFLKRFLTLILLVVAVLVALCAALLSDGGVAEGLRRFSVILVLASEATLFAAWVESRRVGEICALENGIVFTGSSMDQLLSAELLYADPGSSLEVSGSRIQSADPNFLSPENILLLAAHAWSYSVGDTANRLALLYGKALDRSVVSKAQVVQGYGVVANMGENTIISGSAAYMAKAGLAVLPFPDDENAVHVGVNGRYAGCIYLDCSDWPYEKLRKVSDAFPLFSFSSAEEAQQKRQSGEVLVYASAGGKRGIAGSGDLAVSLSPFHSGCDIICAGSGYRALASVLRCAINVRNLQTGCLMLCGVIKAICLILALFGWCPMWLAIALDTAAAWYTHVHVLHGLDFQPEKEA